MIKIDFKFNANDIEKAVMQAASEEIASLVKNVRCPEHGEYARIVASGRSMNDIDFEISGCCDKLVDEVKRKLR